MCVDRLEAGLKPACVSACLGKALDFGVIENIPEGRTQAKTAIPGFPATDITHPNIRFQQTRVTQRDMMRMDSMPLKYHKQEGHTKDGGEFKPMLDPKHGFARSWNLNKLLGSHENAHIAFTLAAQSVMGAFVMLLLPGFDALDTLATLLVMTGLLSFGLFKLNMHLGKPHRFYRGFNNWRLSPVSREIAGVSLFFGGLAGTAFFTLFPGFPFAELLRPASIGAGLLGLSFGGYYMYKLYRIKARPFWDHWQTGASFLGTGLGLGGLLLGLLGLAQGVLSAETAASLGALMALGFALEGIGLVFHARAMNQRGNEGAASHYEQTTRYGWAYLLRNGLLGLSLSLAALLMLGGKAALFAPLALTALSAAILGRALFYVLVIPTTMPGAFFWRNKGFVDHAREVGLARMPQLGVVPEGH
jgi:DMSO reductase anchor subunit